MAENIEQQVQDNQVPEQGNPIYKFMKSNNLTKLDEKAFLDVYSKPEKAKEVHDFMLSNKLTNLDESKFYDTYLKKKEQPVPTEKPSQISAKSFQSDVTKKATPTTSELGVGEEAPIVPSWKMGGKQPLAQESTFLTPTTKINVEQQQQIKQIQNNALTNTAKNKLSAQGKQATPANISSEIKNIEKAAKDGEVSLVRKGNEYYYGRTPKWHEEFAKQFVNTIGKFTDNIDILVADSKNDPALMVKTLDDIKARKDVESRMTFNVFDMMKAAIDPSTSVAENAMKVFNAEKDKTPLAKPSLGGDIAGFVGGIAPKAMISYFGLVPTAVQAVMTSSQDKIEQLYDKYQQDFLSSDPAASAEYQQTGVVPQKIKEAAATRAIKNADIQAAPSAFLDTYLFSKTGGAATPQAKNLGEALAKGFKNINIMGAKGAGAELATAGIEQAQGDKPENIVRRTIETYGNWALMDASFQALPILKSLPKYLSSAVKDFATSKEAKPIVEQYLNKLPNGKEIKAELDKWEEDKKPLEGIVPEDKMGAVNGLNQKIKGLKEKLNKVPESLKEDINVQIDNTNKQIKDIINSDKPAIDFEKDDITGEPVGEKEQITKPIELSTELPEGYELPAKTTEVKPTEVSPEEADIERRREEELKSVIQLKPIEVLDEKGNVISTTDKTVEINAKYDAELKALKEKQQPTEKANKIVAGVELKEPTQEQNDILTEERKTPEWTQKEIDKIEDKDVIDISEIEKKAKEDEDFAILTGTNPEMKAHTDAENAALQEKAIKWLEDRGYKPKKVVGRYGQGEASLFVDGMSLKDASDFRKEFHQDSVAHSKGMIYEGKYEPRVKGNDNFNIGNFTKDTNFATAVRQPDGSIKAFSLDYDFGNKKPLNELIKTEPKAEVKAEPKTVADTVADDLFTHLGIEPEGAEATAPRVYTSENVSELTSEGLEGDQKAVIDSVKNIVTAIDKLVEATTGNKLKVSIYDNQASFTKGVEEYGGSKQDSISKGFYMSEDGTIHINMSRASSETMGHEGFHPVLDYLAANKPEIIDNFHKQLSKLKGGDKIIADAERAYKGMGDTTIKKEAITDFIAKIADPNNPLQLDKTNFEKVKAFVLDMLEKMGLKFDKDIRTIDDLQKLAQVISKKFQKGEEIKFKDGKIANSSEKVQLQSDFKHEESGLEWKYFKNSEDFQKLVDKGYVTFDKNIDDFSGAVVLHAPDAAFSGQILKDGVLVADGKGGMYYPLVFHNNGDFWAATARGANSLAKTLNEARAKSPDGKVKMILVSSPIDKLMSSSLNGIGLVDILTSKAFSDKSGITPEQLRKAIIRGIKTTEKLKSENKDGMKPSQKPLPKITGNESLADLHIKLQEFYPSENSDFPVRKSLNQNILEGIANYSSSPRVAKQLSNFLGEGSFNEKLKSTGGKLSRANLTQGFSNILAEPTLRGEQSGKMYAVIELSADVEPVKTSEHESYPFSLRSVDAKEKPVVHVLKQRDFWYNHVVDEKGQSIKDNKEKQASMLPASAGISSVVELSPKKVEGVSPLAEKAAPQFSKTADLVEQSGKRKEMTEDDKGNYLFFHYSDKKFNKLSPEKVGKHLATGRDERTSVPTSSLYTRPDRLETNVPSDFGYITRVPKEKVYSFTADPLNLMAEAEARFKKENKDRAFDANNQFAYVAKIASEKGFPVTVAEWNIKGTKTLIAKTTEALPLEKYTNIKAGTTNQIEFAKGTEDIKPNAKRRDIKFSKENQDAKIKDFIEMQREKNISDEDIKAGLEKAADRIGLDKNKIDELLTTKKEANAIQKPSPEGVLQPTQEGAGEAGGKRTGMEQGEQGAIPPKEGEPSEEKVGGDEKKIVYTEAPKTAAKITELNRVRNEFGLPELEETEQVSTLRRLKNVENAIADLKKSGKYEEEINKIKDKAARGKISDEGQDILTQRLADLRATAKTLDRYSPEYDKITAQIKDVTDTLKAIGTIAGRTLEARKHFVKEIETVHDIEENMLQDLNTDTLTKAEKDSAQQKFDEYQKINEAAEKALQAKNEELAKLKIQLEEEKAKNELLKQQKAAQKTTPKTKDDYKKERESIKQSIKDKWNNAGKDIISMDLPYRKQLAAITPEVSKLVYSYLEQAAKDPTISKKVKDIVEFVKKELKEFGINISDREALGLVSGEYIEKKQTRNELAKERYELQKEADLLAKIDDLQNDIVKEKDTDKQRKKSTVLKDLEKQLDDLQKQMKVGKYSDEAKNELAQKSAQKSIDDLQEKIDNNELEIEKAEKLNETAKTKELREKRDGLRKEIEQKRKNAKVGKYSDEARFEATAKQQIAANKKKIEEIQQKIKKGDFAPETKKESILLNEELQKKNPAIYNEWLETQVKKEDWQKEYEYSRLKQQAKQLTLGDKIAAIGRTALNTYRTAKATGEISTVLVQNIQPSLNNPRLMVKFIYNAFKNDLLNGKKFKQEMAIVKNSELGDLLFNKMKVALYEPMGIREEAINELLGGNENLLNKTITIGGKKYSFGQAFERIVDSYANNLRAELASREIEYLLSKGKTWENAKEEYIALGRRINEESGHGQIAKPAKNISKYLNMVIWSTKMMASTFNVLGMGDLFRPLETAKQIGREAFKMNIPEAEKASKGYYTSLTPRQRMVAARNLGQFALTGLGIMGMVKLLNKDDDDVKVTLNPFDSSFGVKIGDKQVNPFGRYAAYMTGLLQVFFAMKYREGEKIPLGVGYKAETSGDVAFGRFIRGKMRPDVGLAYDYIANNQKNYFTKERIKPSDLAPAPMTWINLFKDIKRDKISTSLWNVPYQFIGGQVRDQRDFEESRAVVKQESKEERLLYPTKKSGGKNSSGKKGRR